MEELQGGSRPKVGISPLPHLIALVEWVECFRIKLSTCFLRMLCWILY